MDAPPAALRRGLWLVGSLAFLLVGLELGAGVVYRVRTGRSLELGYEHVTDAVARRVAAEAERIRRHGSSSSPAALPADPAPVATRG